MLFVFMLYFGFLDMYMLCYLFVKIENILFFFVSLLGSKFHSLGKKKEFLTKEQNQRCSSKVTVILKVHILELSQPQLGPSYSQNIFCSCEANLSMIIFFIEVFCGFFVPMLSQNVIYDAVYMPCNMMSSFSVYLAQLLNIYSPVCFTINNLLIYQWNGTDTILSGTFQSSVVTFLLSIVSDQ